MGFCTSANSMEDLCNLCIDSGAVFPSIEEFEMGVEIPSIYFIFYKYFFKACVGEVRWKKTCMDGGGLITDPLGSVQAEAIAMLQLKNNYFAWLLEAKERFQDELVTDYDPDSKKVGKKNPAEVYLKKFELNVSGNNNEDRVIGEGDNNYLVLK